MDIAIAILIGLAWGALIGLVKFFIFWRPLLKNNNQQKITTANVMGRYGVSIILDFFALFLPFFLKEYLPFSLQFVLIGTALALVAVGRLCPLSKIIKHVEE